MVLQLAKSAKAQEKVVAYFRTSSAANVGEDKDSLSRQRAAVSAFANRHQYELVGEFYDAAVIRRSFCVLHRCLYNPRRNGCSTYRQCESLG